MQHSWQAADTAAAAAVGRATATAAAAAGRQSAVTARDIRPLGLFNEFLRDSVRDAFTGRW